MANENDEVLIGDDSENYTLRSAFYDGPNVCIKSGGWYLEEHEMVFHASTIPELVLKLSSIAGKAIQEEVPDEIAVKRRMGISMNFTQSDLDRFRDSLVDLGAIPEGSEFKLGE